MSDLLKKLDTAGNTGLDLSPGDQTAKEAAKVIRGHEAALKIADEMADAAKEFEWKHPKECLWGSGWRFVKAARHYREVRGKV